MESGIINCIYNDINHIRIRLLRIQKIQYTLSRADSQRSFNVSTTFARSSGVSLKRLSTNERLVATSGSL